MSAYYWASCEMLFFVKVLVSGFRTPFTLHQVPETLFLNGGIKEFVYYKKKLKFKKNVFNVYWAVSNSLQTPQTKAGALT